MEPHTLLTQLVKHLPAMRERPGFNSWFEKFPWRRKWQPTQLLLLGESHGQRSLAGYSSWDCKSQTWPRAIFIYIYILLRTLTDNSPVGTAVRFWLDFSSPLFSYIVIIAFQRNLQCSPPLKLSKLIVAKCYPVNSNNSALFSSLPLMLHNIQFPWWLKW